MAPVDGCILDTLIELRWLSEKDAEDRAKVGAAIGAMLHDLAKYRHA